MGNAKDLIDLVVENGNPPLEYYQVYGPSYLRGGKFNCPSESCKKPDERVLEIRAIVLFVSYHTVLNSFASSKDLKI